MVVFSSKYKQMDPFKSEMFLAKALYDNVAETPDELAFRRGDVITVIEQDPGGLEGWWLCNLRDKQGIAPGNRLKILSGMIDKEKDKDNIYSSPKSSPRNSWDALKTTQEEELSNTIMQDYDVPRSNRLKNGTSRGSDSFNSPIAHNRSSSDTSFQDYTNQSFYDTPPSNRPVGYSLHSAYDIPTPEKGLKDVNQIPSNRSSTLSTASMDSSATISSCASSNSYHRSSIPSTCDSARSSLDVSSNDFYDVPRDQRTLKQLSTDSGLDLYDSPQKPKPVSQNSFIEDYDVPKGGTLKANKSNSRRGSLEHAIDDIYDVPKNNAPRVVFNTNTGNLSFSRAVSDPVSPMNVYDVPPQVTRDSVISAKSDSSEEGQRLSSCSTDSRLSDIPAYDELLLDLDSALERLVKVQQDVTKSINKLLSFVSSTWRKKESLETKLYEIKLSCTNVKKSLNEFVRFCEGALGNSTKLSDKKLIGKLYKQLNPIQNSLHVITAAMLCLEEDKWQVALLSEPLNSSKPDSLGQITTISKDLTVDVRKLASFIQGNSTLLFKRAYEVDFKKSASMDETGMYSKPPSGSKIYTPRKGGNLQQRPLPPPPPLDRPLPLTPAEQRLKSQSMNSLNYKEKELHDYKNQSLAEDIYSNEEYDYVQLETNDAAAHQKLKEEMDNKSKPEIPIKSKSSSLESLDDELYETLKLHPDPQEKKSSPVPALPEKTVAPSMSSMDLPKDKPVEEIKKEPEMKNEISEVDNQIESVSEKVVNEDKAKDSPQTTEIKDTAVAEISSSSEDADAKSKQPPPSTLPKPSPKPIKKLPEKENVNKVHEEPNSFMEKLNKIKILEHQNAVDENVVSKDDAPENLVPASADLNNSSVDLSQLDISNFIIDDDLKTPVNTNKDLDFVIPEVTFTSSMESINLDTNDKQVLVYYGEQMDSHTTLLSNAIDAFLNCIENSEPPKIFISNSKFVVLSAHKLVYMGDTLHKNLINSQVRNRVMLCANHLCDVLKQSVVATKSAALQYPSVAAVQEMVDRIMDVSHAAHNMKVTISQSAAL